MIVLSLLPRTAEDLRVCQCIVFLKCGEMAFSTSGKSASVSYGEIISATLVCEDINEWSSCIDLLEVSWEYKSSIWLCVKLAGNTKSAM